MRGGENFKYGLGSVRAKYSPQFKSIEQIRSSKDRLISSDAFKEVEAEVQASLDDLDKYAYQPRYVQTHQPAYR